MKKTTDPADIDQILGRQKSARSFQLPRPPKWLLIGLTLLLTAVLAYGLYQWLSNKPVVIKYVTSPVEKGDLFVKVVATGTLSPTNQVQIGSEISGTVSQVFVNSNDFVSKGQVLAIIDTTKLKEQIARNKANVDGAKARLSQSEAALKQAKEDLARQEHVWKISGGQVPSKQELETTRYKVLQAQNDLANLKTTVRQAQADWSSLQVDLRKAQVRSPINGMVLKRQIEPGQTVAASLQAPQLFVIAEDLRRMELQVNVAEADVAQVQPGQTVSFTVDAWPNKSFQGIVAKTEFGSTLVDNVVSYLTKIRVENPDLSLRPGMTATADINTAERKNVVLVPNSTLRFRPPRPDEAKKNKAAEKSGGFLNSLMPKPPRGMGGGGNRQQSGSSNGRSAQNGDGEEGGTKSGRTRGSRVWVLDTQTNQPKRVRIETGLTDGKMTEVTQVAQGQLSIGSQVITAIEDDKQKQ